MKTKQSHLKDAFDYIKQRRSEVSPNFSFMGQLLQFEPKILSSTPTHQAPSSQFPPNFFFNFDSLYSCLCCFRA
uniref:protein-tyrosine-phosphatase n=2 Tax=Bos TaxID=9903 RepID=A0A4W2EVN4_BOBOX